MKTFNKFMTEVSRYKKPKTEFPQSTKTYKSSALAFKAGQALQDLNPSVIEKGSVAVAQYVKSKKYVAVWVSSLSTSMGAMGGIFVDAGHSATSTSLVDSATEQGFEDWAAGNDFVLRWVM